MILLAENLTAAQGGVQVLHVPHLVVEQGRVMAVVGPNGSGKTTLLLCLGGLLAATGGMILFGGREMAGSSGRASLRRAVTMVFQEPLLFDSTVAANIETGLRIRGIKRAVRAERVEESAVLFGISHLLGRSARKLSGGESQRASLARAFAFAPEVLLMDEPFAALDAPSKQSLLADLGAILKQTGSTAVFSTHDLSEAIALADNMAVLNGGLLVRHGPTREVLASPEDPFVAAALASAKAMAQQVMEATGI